MKKTSEQKVIRKPKAIESLGIIVVIISIILLGIRMGSGVSAMYMPLILSIGVITGFGMHLGHTYKGLQEGIVKAVGKVVVPVFILLMIGAVVGLWIASGTIPSLIYYGLKLVSPSYFFAAAFVVSCIMSLATGTSWGTIGSIGVAMMGIGTAIGANPAIACGAVVSGALFGDKMSPVSDTPYMACAVTDVDIFEHIRSSAWTTIPAAVLTAIAFFIIGVRTGGAADMGQVQDMLMGISNGWHINPLHLLPILLFFVGSKLPSLIIIFGNLIIGMAWSMLFQGATLKLVFSSATAGFVSETGIAMVDKVLTNGGIMNMLQVIILLLCATGLGGILDTIGVLESLVEFIVKRAKSTFALVASVMVSSYVLAFLTGNQAMPILLPGIAFSPAFDERGISRSVLSRCVGDSGTIAVPLVPWGSMTGFITVALGVSHSQYWPYLWLVFFVPAFSLIYAATGFGIWKSNEADKKNNQITNTP